MKITEKETAELKGHDLEMLAASVAVVKGSLVTRSVTTKLEVVSDYIIGALCESEELREVVHEMALKKVFEKYNVVGICVNTVMDMKVITYVLLDEETGYNPIPNNMTDDASRNYQFCYCLNLNIPEFSEYGDCFFEKRANSTIHRVS